MTLICCVRKKKVAATPEEKVRQACLTWMIEELGYPPGILTVEKSLNELPHLTGQAIKLANRRLDILVYPQGFPLLLIECKAEKLNDEAAAQAAGYAYLIGAPFVALVSDREAKTGRIKDGAFVFQPGLPPYASLSQAY